MKLDPPMIRRNIANETQRQGWQQWGIIFGVLAAVAIVIFGLFLMLH